MFLAKIGSTVRPYFTTENRGWERPTSRKASLGGKQRRILLTSYDVSSLVVDTLCGRASEEKIAVACFYFDLPAQKEQSSTNVLGALLKQLVSGLEGIPQEVLKVYRRQKNLIGRRGPRLPELVKMLQTVSSSQCTFLCVDALDECAGRCQLDVLNSLQMVLQGSPSTRLFLTGKAHTLGMVKRCFHNGVTVTCIGPSGEDITQYLRARLDEDTTPNAMDRSLRAEILKIIPKNISEVYVVSTELGPYLELSANRYISSFPLVSLSIGEILRETTIHCRRQRLNAMAKGDAYSATIERIKAQGGVKAELGMAALMWVSHSERPLRPDELCHALAVGKGSADLDPENFPSIEALSDCCQGLLAVDEDVSTVRLVHSTLQNYLSSHPDLFDRAHSKIAEACLAYLNFQRLKTPPTSNLADSFLGYSSIYWGIHAKRELSDHGKSLALELFGDYNDHVSARLLLEHVSNPSRFYYSKGFSSFTGLHCASFFGIVEVVAALVGINGCDVNQIDCVGNTPLIWAAGNGHEGVVKLLLEQDGIKPDVADGYGRTALSWAAESGHEAVAGLLLRRGDVNPNKPDYRGKTPLLWAAENGHGGVVDLLLRRDDVNPDRPNDRGQTPLSRAAENGHEGVAGLLLGRGDVDPDRPGFDGRAPLSWAAGNGREGVVKLLLERCDVNPDRPDSEGLAPLSWAVKSGQEGVVRLLLLERNDVNPDRPDKIFGQTPLSSAAENGHEGVVRLLLERNDVDPDRPDTMLGHTPLLWAAGNGYEGVVRLLLERNDVGPDRQGSDGRTPLAGAAWNGHEGVVELLLERNDVNPDRPDTEGQTPLSGAARNGHEGVVELLLGRNDVNPDRPDTEGRTPLSEAARNGHEGVVGLLLERNDVNPDQPDTEGQTPLSEAAQNGHEGVVKLLLKRSNVNPHQPDREGKTLLWGAARNGREGAARLLLGREDVDLNQLGSDTRAPLSGAVEEGHKVVVNLLRKRKDVTPDKPDKSSHTPPPPYPTSRKRIRLDQNLVTPPLQPGLRRHKLRHRPRS